MYIHKCVGNDLDIKLVSFACIDMDRTGSGLVQMDMNLEKKKGEETKEPKLNKNECALCSVGWKKLLPPFSSYSKISVGLMQRRTRHSVV